MSKNRKSNFKGKVTNNVRKQKENASSYGYLQLPKGINIFKEEPNSRMRFDIIPYVVSNNAHPDRDEQLQIAMPGELWYKRPFKIHRNIGGSNDSVVCLQSIGKKCPICEYRAKLLRDGAEKEETDTLKNSLRNLYIVIPIDHKEYDEKPHVWDISQYLFQNLLNEEIEEDEQYEVFPDLEEGLTLKVRFEEKSIGKNKFANANKISFEDRSEAYDESIIEEVPDLDKMLKILSYAELEKKFLEIDDEDIVEDATPRKRKKAIEAKEEEEEAPKKRRKVAKEKEEEEEEEILDDNVDDGRTAGKVTRPNRKSESKNKCPYGYKYGKDTDEKEECETCDVWVDCDEEKENNE